MSQNSKQVNNTKGLCNAYMQPSSYLSELHIFKMQYKSHLSSIPVGRPTVCSINKLFFLPTKKIDK